MTARKPRKSRSQNRRLSVRAVRRSDPDVRRLGRALIYYAHEQAAAEAAAEAEDKRATEQPDD